MNSDILKIGALILCALIVILTVLFVDWMGGLTF